jgi:hypothetical protein
MMKAYYAHNMAIYRTPQEARDIALLEKLGFEVSNPGSPEVEAVMATMPDSNERMAWFEQFSLSCDLIAFRSLPDGTIPSGVAKEIEWFRAQGKPVIELPSLAMRRILDVPATKAYLAEMGQR